MRTKYSKGIVPEAAAAFAAQGPNFSGQDQHGGRGPEVFQPGGITGGGWYGSVGGARLLLLERLPGLVQECRRGAEKTPPTRARSL